MGVGFVSLVLEGVVRWSSLFQKEKDVNIGRQRRDVNKKEPFVARVSDCCDLAHEQPRQFHGRTKARQELPPLFRQRESPPRELRPDNLNNNRLRTSQLQNTTALKETTYIVAKS